MQGPGVLIGFIGMFLALIALVAAGSGAPWAAALIPVLLLPMVLIITTSGRWKPVRLYEAPPETDNWFVKNRDALIIAAVTLALGALAAVGIALLIPL